MKLGQFVLLRAFANAIGVSNVIGRRMRKIRANLTFRPEERRLKSIATRHFGATASIPSPS